MSLHRISGTHLARHSSLLNAFVYPVIEAFSVDDVWTYLLQVQCPWGNDNRDLVAMYRSAQAGECPLVVDTTTPSCGNSRFGCWVCTVVSQDRSMQSMVDSGEDWLAPLLDFRGLLAETQDPDKKRQYRDFRRKSGRVSFIGDSARPVPGPYKLEFCKQLLRQLLVAQRQVQSSAPEDVTVSLIQAAELHDIRRIWRLERGDWADSVPVIFREVHGYDLEWVADDAATFGAEDAELLRSICETEGVPEALVRGLVDVERSVHGLKRRHDVHRRIEDLLSQEWRVESEVVAERELRLRAQEL